jgi:hypothetical protein
LLEKSTIRRKGGSKMLGIFITVLIGIYQYLFITQTFEVIYLSLTHFLFWWYIITSGIAMLLIAAISIGITGYGAYKGSGLGYSGGGKILGGLLGLAGGGAFSLVLMAVFAVGCGLKIGGVYLLSTAVTVAGQGYAWDIKTLIFGALALLLGLIMGKSSRSSSSK